MLKRDFFNVHIHKIRENNFTIGEHRFEFVDLPLVNNSGLKFEVSEKQYAFTDGRFRLYNKSLIL